MTPAINQLRQEKVLFTIHEYSHDSSGKSYGIEAAEKLGISATIVFKTLVVILDNKELAVGIIPVSSLLSMKKMAKASGAKKAEMAQQIAVERSTGYLFGGISPLGQKRKLKTVIDYSAEHLPTILVSAGRRGLEIELQPDDLKMLSEGLYFDICQNS